MLPVASGERGGGYPDEPALLTHDGEQPGGDRRQAGAGQQGTSGPLTGRRRTWWRVRRSCYIVILALVIVPPVAFFIAYRMVSVPTPEAAAAQLDKPVTYLFAGGSKLDVHTPSGANRTLLTPKEIPATMVHAAEAAEDATFQTNAGFDISGITQAAFKHLTGGDGGGSTISQQYVKQATGNDQHTYLRKALEVVRAYKMNRQQSKTEIMTAYLNTIYFGRGAYGVGAAAHAYFDEKASQLTPSQAALLAGLIQAPSRFDDASYVHGRWHYVIRQMRDHHWIAPDQYRQASFPDTVPAKVRSGDTITHETRYLRFVVDRVKAELKSKGLSPADLQQAGATVHTTIKPKAEKAAVAAAHKVMSADREYKTLEASLVSIDPDTGGIVAYYGGDPDVSSYDMAQVPHHPGSSFKPFTFLAAMEQDPTVGLGTTYNGTPNQTIEGQLIHNAGGEGCGKNCTVKTGMTKSVNTVFANMAAQAGVDNVRHAAYQAGIAKKLPYGRCGMTPTLVEMHGCKPGNPAIGIAIGQYPVRTVDMAQAYATFANQGLYTPAHLVTKVTDAHGNVLYQATQGPKPAFDKGDRHHNGQLARNVTASLSDVAEYSGTPLAGNRPNAAKTGTATYRNSGHNMAAWMVGYTPQVATAVWVGHWNHPAPIYGNYKNIKGTNHHYDIYGREEPAYIWQGYMNSYLQNKPVKQFGTLQPLGKPLHLSSSAAPPPALPSTGGYPPAPTGESGNGGGGGFYTPPPYYTAPPTDEYTPPPTDEYTPPPHNPPATFNPAPPPGQEGGGPIHENDHAAGP
jgi:membrane peptidoglycan carboxypeptidase